MALSKDDLIAIMRDDLYVDVSAVDERTPLFSSGLIDSFALATLIAAVEQQAGFRMAPLDITLDNLDSIERILRFAASRVA